jgi:hypothetical protein
LADDPIAGSVSNERFHCIQAEGTAELIKEGYPEFIINKIYMDNYDRKIINSNIPQYLDAHNALIDKLNSGILALDFVGHGSQNDWTHEYILKIQDILNLKNKRLPLWITATCGFSRYDSYNTSGGETAFLNPDGGAIALISTTRMVFSAFNDMLNKAVFKFVFEKENRQPLRLGDILRKAKVSLGTQQNKLKFALIGDPALRLSYPGNEYRVEVKEINGLDVSASGNIQIQAASNNHISGAIVKSNGQVAADFSGKIDVVVFDNELSLKTRGHKLPAATGDMSVPYKDYTNTIYSATATVTNGLFAVDFVTPLDILYTGEQGKMSFYAYSENGNEAQGSFSNYKVGGVASETAETNPPAIRQLYLNDTGFQSGDKVNMSPQLSAVIYDDTGINLSGAIGHNISLTIDDEKSYNISPYFVVQDLDAGETGALGIVNFTIPDLTSGRHTLRLKAWDVFNNSTDESVEFECVEEVKRATFGFEIQNNPALTSAKFVFRSELSYLDVEVKYEVYSTDGSLLWSHAETGTAESLSGRGYEWDLTPSGGGSLQSGIYLCRMSVRIDGQVKASKTEKLVVLKQ